MGQTDHALHSLLDQLVRRHSIEPSDESSSAGVAETLRIVKTCVVDLAGSVGVLTACHIVYVYRFLSIHCFSQCECGYQC